VFLGSARVALTATLIALVIGYPAAFAIAISPRRRHTLLLFLVMLPFWTNYLIRTYAWMVLLNRAGLVNAALIGSGLAEEPLPLLYNEFAVVLGLVYSYLPFVILSIYTSISRLDPALIEASADLGASGWRTFVKVMLPLTLPGIATGAVFIFVLSIGNFVTADLLGGGQVQMIGNLIYDQFLTARDWPFGAVLSLALVGVMLILLFAQAVIAARAARRGAMA
jgi:spermidine/putrescine transport system permease protein